MSGAKVTAIFGGPAGVPEVSKYCVELLEEWLEMAKAGEIVGVVLVGLCHDKLSRYAIGGHCGGYSLVGCLEIAKTDLIDMNRSSE